ncbi:MAG: DUF4931 domain-containing protein [Patescibacteria group bacterium]|nr:DUF4931 domain-containing protein [Patescibacteria group bacterium]MBU1871117.1 DUF4931 domain-containing protein [Patescibacteria group bacterium]
MLKSEIRKDYLLDKYVIITPGRIKRPHDIKEQSIIFRTSECPFCLENVNSKNIIDSLKNFEKDQQIFGLKNLFPAVSIDNPMAYGMQEVIVETPNHDKELYNLSEKHIEQLLRFYAQRTLAISRDKKIDYILCFKNQGSKAGASIVHAHSQILATTILPPEIKKELLLAKDYTKKHSHCPYCDIINKEMKSERKIFEDKNIASFTPYASQYHYEVWLFTKRHLDNIAKLNDGEFISLAKILKKVLVKLSQLDLSFNFFLDQVISDKDQHFYLKIQPRDSIWAGVELGSGLVINSVVPEIAAKYYRK